MRQASTGAIHGATRARGGDPARATAGAQRACLPGRRRTGCRTTTPTRHTARPCPSSRRVHRRAKHAAARRPRPGLDGDAAAQGARDMRCRQRRGRVPQAAVHGAERGVDRESVHAVPRGVDSRVAADEIRRRDSTGGREAVTDRRIVAGRTTPAREFARAWGVRARRRWMRDRTAVECHGAAPEIRRVGRDLNRTRTRPLQAAAPRPRYLSASLMASTGVPTDVTRDRCLRAARAPCIRCSDGPRTDARS